MLKTTDPIDPDTPLSRAAAGAYLRKKYLVGSQSFLAKAALAGGGPPFEMFQNRTLYRPRTLDQWAEARLRGPRVEAAHRPAKRSLGEVA
jgi:hypothetical protein